ncbi:MAG: ComEC/Rec2 family competence protein [Chitinophagaceae bacterium]
MPKVVISQNNNDEMYFWKKAPFIKLLLSLIVGIVIQWYWQLAPVFWYAVFAAGLFIVVTFFYFSLFKRYRFGFLNGIATLLPFTALGALLVCHNDIRHSDNWVGYHHKNNLSFAATLEENPVEKTKSFKANASINYIIENDNAIPLKGKIIIYFKKDLPAGPASRTGRHAGSLISSLEYGSQILFKKSLQEIKNAGNPGGFDYKRYSLFHGITHQVYLQPDDFIVLPVTHKGWFTTFLNATREKVLKILRTNIKGDKESGLAEALLIGYKDDLDKTLVQSYTNTGVIHIIAISGLHLGLIYWLLVQLLKPMRKNKYAKWLRPLIIICGLWLFSLLAGAQPSILRSAVMFTGIVLGESLTKKTSLYNNLALSAFLLLCYNPFWLWDAGFQLSYSAVLSIVIFFRPVYNLVYVKNKLLDFFWKLNAVTIAAQILTLPVSIYHFHQFPVHFLLTNFVAVPLSSLILLGEIFLCVISFIPAAALLSGKMLTWLIWLMNSYIEKIEALPFSLWDGLQISMAQVVFLLLFIASLGYWLLEKSKAGLKIGLISLLFFFTLRSFSYWEMSKQQKIIVYNVPQHRAIDFINGRHYFFEGDPDLQANDFARNFHLKPSRILLRTGPVDTMQTFFKNKNYILFGNKTIMLIDTSVSFSPSQKKFPIDLLIVSKNPKFYFSRLTNSLSIKKVVFDGSTPAWKLKYWKKDCDSLHIPYHDVVEKGAFVMNLN